MICRFDNLRRYPTVFLKMTGLRLNEFTDLLDDMLPRFAAAEQARLQRSNRQRLPGGGRHADLAPRDQILLATLWLRQYPTNEVLGFLFAVSDSTVSRVVNRLVPLLEASGKDTMRLPDPGRKRRKELDTLLKETPELAVIIDTFEQRVQRCKDPKQADAHYNAWCELGLDYHSIKSANARRGRPSRSFSQIQKLCNAIVAANRA